jgi:hypothetical protein
MASLENPSHELFSPGSMVARLLPSLVYSAVIPVVVYFLATRLLQWGTIPALLLASLSPLVGMLVEFRRQHTLSILGSLGFAGIVASIASALLVAHPRLVLIADSVLSAVVALIFLGSVLVGQRLTVALVSRMDAGSAEARLALKKRLIAQERLHLQALTRIWGRGFLLLLAASVGLTLTLPLTAVVSMRPIIDRVLLIGLIVLTLGYRWYLGRRRGLGVTPAGSTDGS